MSEKRALNRAADRRLIGDLIAQAAVDQDQGLLQFSKKLERLIGAVMERLGHEPPNRVNLSGLIDLIEESIPPNTPGKGRGYPLVFRTTTNGLTYRWVTVGLEPVQIKGEEYTAMVVDLHEE